MLRKLLVVASTAVFVACGETTAPRNPTAALVPTTAAMALAQNDRTPFYAPVVNPCNGETVPLYGDSHIMVKQNTTAVTRTHFSGIGTVTLAKYEGSQTSKEVLLTPGDGTFRYSVDYTIHLVAQGNVPNFYLDGTSTFGYDGTDFYSENPPPRTRCQ